MSFTPYIHCEDVLVTGLWHAQGSVWHSLDDLNSRLEMNPARHILYSASKASDIQPRHKPEISCPVKAGPQVWFKMMIFI